MAGSDGWLLSNQQGWQLDKDAAHPPFFGTFLSITYV
jgi:hypothetical protein